MRPVPPPRPALVVNRAFMQAFLAADTPCCALGLVEEGQRPYGLLALRLEEPLPPAVAAGGFAFGHSALGTSTYEVSHFAFVCAGFQTYNVRLKPNNPLVRAVLAAMLDGGEYVFFALDPENYVTTFRADLGDDTLAGLHAHRARLHHSTTTEAQYQLAVAVFAKDPQPPGSLLQWVCREEMAALDLLTDRLALTPAWRVGLGCGALRRDRSVERQDVDRAHL